MIDLKHPESDGYLLAGGFGGNMLLGVRYPRHMSRWLTET